MQDIRIVGTQGPGYGDAIVALLRMRKVPDVAAALIGIEQRGMGREVLWMLRAALLFEIARRADEQNAHPAEPPREQARIRQIGDAQGEIKTIADNVDDLIAEA